MLDSLKYDINTPAILSEGRPCLVMKYPLSRILPLAILVSVHSTSAEAQVTVSQSLSVDTEFYEQSLYTQNREFRFSPLGFNIGYHVTLNQQWQFSARAGKFEDNIHGTGYQGDFDNQSLAVLAGFTLAPWWFTLSYQEDKDNTRIIGTGERRATLNDELKLTSTAVESARDFTINDAFWMTLGLSIEYQQQTQSTITQAGFADSAFSETSELKSDGWLAGVNATASYFYGFNETTAIVPGVSINWSEPLSGETHGSTTTRWRSPSGPRVRQSHSSFENSAGSGAVDLLLNLIVSDFTINAGISMPFDSDFDTGMMNDGKHLWLGTSYHF